MRIWQCFVKFVPRTTDKIHRLLVDVRKYHTCGKERQASLGLFTLQKTEGLKFGFS